MKSIVVKLQEGLVVVTTDPARPVVPARLWHEVARVGFEPAGLEVRATATLRADAVELDGGAWPLARPGPWRGERRRARFRVLDGGADPPRVEVLE